MLYILLPQFKNFHLLGLFSNKPKLNFQTLFYGQPQQFSKGFSYPQIVQWELFHKLGDLLTNIFLS
jgi:hypothetical protein